MKKPKTKSVKRSKAPKSAFLEWFHQQAGKTKFWINTPKYEKLKHQTIPNLRYLLQRAEAELKAADDWEHARRYALYGWVARAKDESDALQRK